MPIDMNTHGLDWKRHVRANDVFMALVTPHWHTDRRCQRQLAYARQLGKPITLLVQEGTPLPAMREGEVALPWSTVEELAVLVRRQAEVP